MTTNQDNAAASLDGRRGPTPWEKVNLAIFALRTADEHAGHLVPWLNLDSRILDVGCGLGSIAFDFAAIASRGSVIGIDTDATSIRMANQQRTARNVDNIEFMMGDVYDLSRFNDGSFDVVHAHQVMLHLADPIKALVEMRRVVKSGGVIAIRDNVDLHFLPHDPILEKNKQWFRDFSVKQGADPAGGLRNHIWMEKAGFPWDKIQTSSASWDYSSPEMRKVWAEGNKNSMRSVGVKMGYGSESEFDEIERRWLDWADKNESRILALDSVVMAWK